MTIWTPPYLYTATVLKSTPLVFILCNSPNMNTWENEVDTMCHFNTPVFAV